jgi:hypothetical protein
MKTQTIDNNTVRLEMTLEELQVIRAALILYSEASRCIRATQGLVMPNHGSATTAALDIAGEIDKHVPPW